MIHILRDKANAEQIAQMLEEYESMIKIVVDIRRRIQHVESATVKILGGVQ